MNETDERYSIAEEAIFDAFFLLLQSKELDKITVADVTKKAGIVRSTFYNHYENVPALIAAAEDKTLHDIFSMMESFHPKNDHDICHSYFLAVCNYTKKNTFLAHILHSPRGDAFFEKAINMFHKYVTKVTQTTIAKPGDRTRFSYLVASSIGGTIGVLHKWIAEDFKAPADEIADILSSVFLSGIMPYLHQV